MTENKNELFDIIKAIFSDAGYINNLTYETAKQNIFMVNRRLAIKYPLHAQAFNISKANPMDTLRAWTLFLNNWEPAPGWIYTPGSAKLKGQRDSGKIKESLKRKFAQYYQISIKDIDACMRFFPESTLKEFKEFESLLKELEKIEKNEETDN